MGKVFNYTVYIIVVTVYIDLIVFLFLILFGDTELILDL